AAQSPQGDGCGGATEAPKAPHRGQTARRWEGHRDTAEEERSGMAAGRRSRSVASPAIHAGGAPPSEAAKPK
ncbi:MAG TPA: hypothetical protein VLB08_04750, partial [Candidatus Deferrimicrobium sp.]|nr:hypothetical protein [Candidatus Deferrimicrobium sp.]